MKSYLFVINVKKKPFISKEIGMIIAQYVGISGSNIRLFKSFLFHGDS